MTPCLPLCLAMIVILMSFMPSWDLYKIGGLPIHGKFYDKVVPYVEEFSHRNSRGLLASYQYLLFAYHKLSQEVKGKSGVKVTSWIRFWYLGYDKV